MRDKKVFSILCFFMLALGPASGGLAADNPAEYEKAKVMLEKLRSGKGDAADWGRCAALFQKVWQENPRWGMRHTALFRSAVALEGKARVTKKFADARSARSLYERMAVNYPKSSLADDALYRAALVSSELLGDDAAARSHITLISKKYPQSDHAKAAVEYEKNLPSRTVPPPKDGKQASPRSDRKPPERPARGRDEQAPPAPSQKKADGSQRAGRNAGLRQALPDQRRGSLASQLGLSVRNIVLDAGHGGKDPGTMHFGVIEREVTLDVVKRMEKLLRGKGFSVYLSRGNDGWVSLSDRVRFGRKVKGDLFVSIHVNACDNPLISGMETYILDFARTSDISRLAMAENADSGRLGDMDRVLAEILVGARTSESRRLASFIQKRSVESLKSKGTSIIDGGVKGAPFFVLVGASMPSVLVEIGYCTNEAEANRLKLPGQRQFLAEGIVDGILAYAGRSEAKRGSSGVARNGNGKGAGPEPASAKDRIQPGKIGNSGSAAKTDGRGKSSGGSEARVREAPGKAGASDAGRTGKSSVEAGKKETGLRLPHPAR